MATVVRYLCPHCQKNVDSVFAMPPTQPLAPCAHCGKPVLRSAAAMTQAWSEFCIALAGLLGFGGNLAVGLGMGLTGEALKTHLCFGIVIAAAAAAVGAGLGYFIGQVMACRENAPLDLPPAPHDDGPRPTAAGLHVPSPRLGQADLPLMKGLDVDALPRPKKSPMRCWHCGCGFAIDTGAGPVAVRCPKCKSNLGMVGEEAAVARPDSRR